MRLIRAYRGILCKLSLCTDLGETPNPAPRRKKNMDSRWNKLVLTTIADAELTMRKRGTIFRTLSIGIGYQAQTVVRTQIGRYYSQ